MKSFKSYIAESTDHSGIENIDHYVSHADTQYGSNPGGVHTDPKTGEKHYVKFYSNPEQARSEVASAGIYKMMGAGTVNPRLVSHSGRIAVASKWDGNLKTLHKHDFSNLPEDTKHEMAKHLFSAVLTKNWDTVGIVHDNIKANPKTGAHHIVDTGGSFKFRAQGGPKDYDDGIGEFKSLRDPHVNPEASHVFGQLGPEHFATAKAAMGNVTRDKVSSLFHGVGMEDAEEKTNHLMAKKAKLEAV